jgi:hypothetical protein
MIALPPVRPTGDNSLLVNRGLERFFGRGAILVGRRIRMARPRSMLPGLRSEVSGLLLSVS